MFSGGKKEFLMYYGHLSQLLFLKKLKTYSTQEIRFQHFKKNMAVLNLLRFNTAYPKLCMLNFLVNVKYFLRKGLIICSFALDIYSRNRSLKS